MSTLAEFLLARIEKDEAAAREYLEVLTEAERQAAELARQGVTASYALSDFISGAGHPARVLAECEAKRGIVANHASTVTGWHEDDGESVLYCTWCHRQWPCADLRLLALPYADHEAYREEWRP